MHCCSLVHASRHVLMSMYRYSDWDLRTEVSLFTGKPSNVLSVTPDSVKYGPRSDKADHWKSLGPMNLLVLSYLDDDLRIMRGNTSTDTLFIFKKCK